MKSVRLLIQICLFGASFFLLGQEIKSISEGTAHSKLADSLYNLQLYDSALFHSKKSLDAFYATKNDSLILTSLFQLISITNKVSTNGKSKYLNDAEQIAIVLNNPFLLSEVYFLKGKHHYNNFEDDLAIQNFLLVDSISHEHDFINNTSFIATIQIARLILFNINKNIDSLTRLKLNRYIDQGLHYSEVIGENVNKIKIYDLIGLVHATEGERKEALKYYRQALKYIDKSTSPNTLSDIYWNLAANYLRLKQNDSAEYYYKLRTSLFENTGQFEDLALTYSSLGGFYNKVNRYSDGAKYQKMALDIYDKLKSKRTGNILGTLDGLAYSYAKLNRYKEAYEILDRAYSLSDSLSLKQNTELTLELESKYQTEKKEQEIALLNSEKEVIEQQKINQRNLLLGGIGFTSIIGIFLFYQYQNRKKTNKKLRELDSLKSKFFANISHEFRTPLTLISGPVEQRLDSKKLSKTDRQDFEMISRNSKRLLNLVDQLLDLSKLEAGRYKIRIVKDNLGNLLRVQAEAFQFMAKQRDIAYETMVSDLQEVWFDKDIIEKIMANLLSNAIKYTAPGGSITIRAREKNKAAEIKVENTASSLDSVNLEKLFDRFYQGDTHAEGVGIGLSLVKELVNTSGGTIKVHTLPENTIQFIVVLPVARSAYKSDALFQKTPTENPATPSTITSFSTAIEKLEDLPEEEQRDILLIVEDNAEVRQLIRNTFADTYQIIVAENGKLGIEMAIETIPDLIISDIMMPIMDGLQLCETLKTDERTSHIPVILLTARAGEEDQYKGLSSGADAYVTKPFKIKMLKTRVTQLISSRKTLRKRYSQEVILRPKDIAISNLDEVFLERVQKVLDSKLLESSFSTEEFSQAVGMSRMQLHRKLKALTGLSATEFVRSQRLKLAADLLRKSDANVSQIGYEVGFNDPSYFAKCFKEAYGVSPTEYSKKPSS